MADTAVETENKPSEQDSSQQNPPPKNGRLRRLETIAVVLLSLCAATSLLWQAIEENLQWFTGGNIIQQAKVAAATDIDQDVFLKHIAHHPTFASTFVWWHTAWLGDEYPWYWRPLTMLAFWTEDHLFGAYRFDRWQVADIVFHILFAVLLGVFAYQITRNKFAPALTILAFTSFVPLSESLNVIGSIFGFSSLFTTPAANVILANWKNQVEPWGGLCALGAMLLSVKGRWWAGLACAVAGICFKESGWLAFPMVLAMLVYTGKLKTVPLSVWIGTGLAVVILLALRACGGPHLIAQAHHDSRLHIERYFLSITDQNVHTLATNRWAIIVLGCFLAALVFSPRLNLIKKMITGAVLFLVMGAVVGLASGTSPIVGIALLADPTLGLASLFCSFIECLALILAWREPGMRRLMIFLYCLVLISALPVISVLQPDYHMLYLANAFQSTLTAAVAIAAARQAWLILRPQRKISPIPEPAG
jgi:hypothetical protein